MDSSTHVDKVVESYSMALFQNPKRLGWVDQNLAFIRHSFIGTLVQREPYIFRLSTGKVLRGDRDSGSRQLPAEQDPQRHQDADLYDKDKLLFCLQLVLNNEISLNAFEFNDYQIFLKGDSAYSGGDKGGDLIVSEIFAAVKDNVLALTQISLFKEHQNETLDNVPERRKVMESSSPDMEPLPKFCEYMMPSTMVSMGKISIEAGNKSPIIFLLSAGSDHTPLEKEVCKKAKQNLSMVSMEQGREQFAEAHLQNSKVKVEWVLLQNCQLGLKYMNQQFAMSAWTSRTKGRRRRKMVLHIEEEGGETEGRSRETD
jgi:hypothetical protein